MDSPVGQAGFGDALREGFHQPDVACVDDGADRVGDNLVVHHAGQLVLADRRTGKRPGAVVCHAEIDVDADALRRGVLVRVDADTGGTGFRSQAMCR